MNHRTVIHLLLFTAVTAIAQPSTGTSSKPANPSGGGTTGTTANPSAGSCEIVSRETVINGAVYVTTFKTKSGVITVRWVGPLVDGQPVAMLVTSSNPGTGCRLQFGETELALPAAPSSAAMTTVTPVMPRGSVYQPLRLLAPGSAPVAAVDLAVTPAKPKPSPFTLPCPETEWFRTNYFASEDGSVSVTLSGDEVTVSVPGHEITHRFSASKDRLRSLQWIFEHLTTNQVFGLLQQETRQSVVDGKATETADTWSVTMTGPDPFDAFASDTVGLNINGSFMEDGKRVDVVIQYQFNPCTRKGLWFVALTAGGATTTYAPEPAESLYSEESLTTYVRSVLDQIRTNPLDREPRSRWDVWLKVYLNLLPYAGTDPEKFEHGINAFRELIEQENRARNQQDRELTRLFDSWNDALHAKSVTAMTNALVALVARQRS